MRSIPAFCCLLLLCSCRQNHPALQLSTFREVPKEINAGSFFAQNGSDLEKGNYLFVQDYDSVAFVFINDKLVRMRLSACIIDSVANTMDETYEQNDLTVKLNAKYVNDAGDKEHDFEGRITVKNSKGDSVAKNVVGYDLVE